MPVEILKEMQQRLPDVDLWNFYGQTEMAPLATILGPDRQLSHAGSAGRAALNVETRIVDDDDRPVPSGTVGEIVHRSPHATLGYYGDEDKTADAFRAGWFHSGDLGYIDETGLLYVVDRKKDMIKSGGENVASRELTLAGAGEVRLSLADYSNGLPAEASPPPRPPDTMPAPFDWADPTEVRVTRTVCATPGCAQPEGHGQWAMAASSPPTPRRSPTRATCSPGTAPPSLPARRPSPRGSTRCAA